MHSPVYTRIVNHYPIDKVLAWAGETPIFIAAKSEVTVPYDIWSLAGPGQREGIKSELESGNIELWIGVLSKRGYTETHMAIDGQYFGVTYFPVGEKELPIASSGTMEISTADVKPEMEKYTPVPEPAPVVDKPSENIVVIMPEDPRQDAITAFRAKFDEHVANKQWANALAAMKGVYGDRITFGPRAVMTAKSWDALVTKYRLTTSD